jgi:hypothetical protein
MGAMRATKNKEKMMDYKTLAIQIASAEDPYGEFAKEASALDDVHKTTLAREVNKQFFISRIEGREHDGHIDFNVLEPAIKDTHENKSIADPTVEKTASDNSKENKIDKASMVDASMFVLSAQRPIKASSFANDGSSAFRKIAEHIIDDELEKEEDAKADEFKRDKIRAVAVLNDMFGAEVENITKIANDASELRSVIGMVIDGGLAEIIPEMIAVSNDAESTLLKVASVSVDNDREQAVHASIDQLKEIANAKKLVKEASSYEELEKIALYGLIGGLLRTGFKIGKLGYKATKLPGKIGGAAIQGTKSLATGKNPLTGAMAGWNKGSSVIMGAAKLPGRVTGAIGGGAKGLLSGNPMNIVTQGAKGFANGGTTVGALGTIGVLGATGLEIGPAMNKYQNMALRT